jgi:hypothetical protein
MEKKKIISKIKLNAAMQEDLLLKLQQNTANAVNEDTAALNVQQNTAPSVIEYSTALNTQQSTAAAVKLNKNTEAIEKEVKTQRITVDMPIDLYERMKDEVEDRGQTIKGFIVGLVKTHFAKKAE